MSFGRFSARSESGKIASSDDQSAHRRRSHRAFKAEAAPRRRLVRETFRDEPGHKGRARSTAILFLLKAGEVAHWHRVNAAELWHGMAAPHCC